MTCSTRRIREVCSALGCPAEPDTLDAVERHEEEVLRFPFEVESLKPEPAIYLTACRRLSLLPDRCLFVGDGNDRELEGALAVGMTAVRIERPDAMEPYRRDPSRRWSHSVADLRQITDLPWDRQISGTASES